MENNKYKSSQNEKENQETASKDGKSVKKASGECASETVHLKDGPWHETQKNTKPQNPKGKSMGEATDPSKLSQL